MNKGFLIICFLAMTIALTGCWDKVEINDRAYVISLGLDDLGETLQVTYTIPNLPVITGLGSGEATKFIKVAEADTLYQANKEFGTKSNLKINFDHTKIVIFGKDFLSDRENLEKVMDHFDRNPEYAKSLLMLSTQGSARDLLESVPNGEETTGIYLSQVFINNSEETIRSNVIELGNFIIKLYESNGNATIPNVRFDEGEVVVDGLAILKEYEVAGYLEDDDLLPYSWLLGKGKNTLVVTEMEGVKIPFEINEIETKMDFSMEDGLVHIDIKVNSEGDISEYSLGKDNKLFDNEFINEVEIAVAAKMEDDIKSLVKFIQQNYGIDIIGAFDKLKTNNKKIWKLTKDEWDSFFKSASITVECKVDIRRIGLAK